MTERPRNLSELVKAYAEQQTNALRAPGDPAAEQPPAFYDGAATGWLMAWRAASLLLPRASADPLEKVTLLIADLRDACRATADGPDLSPQEEIARRGKYAALQNAILIAQGALAHLTVGVPDTQAARDSWAGYPKSGLPLDHMVDDISVLAMFLGGDATSFTGKVLLLMQSADPTNLNRLAVAFPHEVQAWLMWRTLAPVRAGTLLEVLKSTTIAPIREPFDD